MKLCITGQDTLAAAARECCARHFELRKLSDPDLDILWVCYDTPIDEETGEPKCDWVLDRIGVDFWDVTSTPIVLISSQMPVGTIAGLEQRFPKHTFACSPENIRVASAVADFLMQARVVVGIRKTDRNALLKELFSPFTQNLIFTTPETAEMVKHALNAYLGMSIAYINEIARICKFVGADVDVVSKALLSERRISPKAPLKPGAPFGGGHLMRDILTLEELARQKGLCIPIISHIRESNEGK